jgi:glutamyl-tRNA synthetase
MGHARTFWIAAQRAAEQNGALILRNEDLDSQRCRAEFVDAMFEDLRWLGISWTEGPDCGGPYAPYTQSERREFYVDAWRGLREAGMIYPCTCSRKDVALAAGAPNDGDDEPVYPGKCRPPEGLRNFSPHSVQDLVPHSQSNSSSGLRPGGTGVAPVATQAKAAVATRVEPAGLNWRFRVPDGEEIDFIDLHLGPQKMIAGKDFGDFIVWRRDDVPAYQLAVVVDDAAMQISEVVRGADLLKSTARQILLFRALGQNIPDYYHCDLVRDDAGVRLAKRHDSLSVRQLRAEGFTPEQVRSGNLTR